MTELIKPATRPLEPTELLTLLLEVSEQVASTLDLEELMVRIAESVKRAMDYEVFAILLLDEKTEELRVRFSHGHPDEVVRQLRIKVGEGIVGRAAALKRSIIVNDVRKDPDYIESLANVRSELAVPLVVEGRVIGVIDLEASVEGVFTDQHRTLLELLAGRIALAIENARLYEAVKRSEALMDRDLKRAREIQSYLLPSPTPRIPGLEVCVRFQPARHLGGDLYDFLCYDKDRYVLAVGDVSGKGAPAALYGAMAGGILRSLARQCRRPAKMLRRLHEALLERKIEGHFITLAYGLWEPRARRLRLANAGMPAPLLVRRGVSRPLRAEGVPLGLLERVDYRELALTLERGDLIAMFSDGLMEASNQQEEFGLGRIRSVLTEFSHRPVAEIVKMLFAQTASFEGGRPQRDDQTLLLFRVR